jgi:hypothetical protein
MSDTKPDSVALAHKALDAAILSAKDGSTGTVSVIVNVREGTPNGPPKVVTELVKVRP